MKMQTVSIRIKHFLKEHPNMSYNGSQIARRLGIDYHLVNGALQSLTAQRAPWLDKTNTQSPAVSSWLRKHHPEAAQVLAAKRKKTGPNRPRYSWREV